MDLSKFKDIFISETEDHLQKLNDNLLKFEKDSTQKGLLDELMRSAHTIKSSAATMGYQKTAYLVHVLEDIFDYARNGALKIDQKIIDEVYASLDGLGNSISEIKKNDKELNLDSFSEKIKKITGVATEGVGKSARDEKGLPIIKNNSVQLEDKEEVKAEKVLDQKKEEATDKIVEKIAYIKVPVNRLDELMDLTEELLIEKMKVENIISQSSENNDDGVSLIIKLKPTIEHLNNLISNLQYAVMQARLIPVGQIFARFPRMIRDMNHAKNKEAELEISGEDLELDRTVVDKLGEPLVHLLRNAFDHGIEKAGRIKLIAQRDRDMVVIRVEDDGRGIDWSEVVKHAEKKGIISGEKATELNEKLAKNNKGDHQDREIESLIFHPRLSTSETVTETSGRGVGLSVVEKFIEGINGNVYVESPIAENGGTRFTLELPLTLAIVNSLLVDIGGLTFAIPFTVIERVVELETKDVKSMADQDVAVIDDTRIPLANLEKIFDLHNLSGKLTGEKLKKDISETEIDKDTKEEKVINNKITVVLVKRGKEMAGLIVDRLLSEQEIIVKPLPEILRGVRGFSGSTILGDGSSVLIMDALNLLEDKKKLLRV